MVVYNMEEKASSKRGCYPTLSGLYSMIPRDVRLHMERVGIYGEVFCKYLLKHDLLKIELENEFVEHLRDMYTLHDIGRAFVPVRFQNKAGGLTEEEYEQVKRHTTLTPDVLDSIYELELSEALQRRLLNIALYHHERWDGTGYPFQLKEEQIPMEASICALVDAYDGMTSWKPYRSSMDIETVKKIILKEAGKQFHPGLAWAFVSCVDSFPKDLGAEWEAQAGRYFCTN